MEGQTAKRMRLASPAKGHQQVSSDASPEQNGQATQQAVKMNRTTQPAFRVPGLIITDHTFKVPLDYTGQQPGEITIFAREVIAGNHTSNRHSTPYLLFLQGGPGFEAPRPTEASGWLRSAVGRFRVVLMDQRGTGHSTGITVNNLKKRGSPEEQARYLSCFRADSIVRDAEVVRQALVPSDNNQGRWSVLGQSFGGFCLLTYLSFAPQGLAEAFFTGGIPPGVDMPCSAERTYEALFKRVQQQNDKYYQRYPQDVQLVQRIVQHLQQQPAGGVATPGGTLVTPEMLQLLGMTGLGAAGFFDRLHYLLESFFDSEGGVNPAFLKSYDSWMPWDVNPLYALLHEPIYCQQGAASNWAAQRVREQHYQHEFDPAAAVREGRPVLFTGEMVFPFLFEHTPSLRPYKAAADLLAAKQDWPPLYDTDVLRENIVPAAAATYYEDMYVDFDLAQETSRWVGGLRQWITNEYKHSGIRDDGARILDKLCNLTREGILLE